MKTLWVGFMIATFVLGIGIIPLIYIFGRWLQYRLVEA